MGSYFRDFYAPKATQQPTIGDTKFSVIRQDHMGWMNCDGRLVSTEDYPLLFRVVQYSFGGSGDQFRLPDMRSRVPGAISQGTGLTNRTLGDAVGTETHTLTIAEMPAHTHGSVAVSGNSNGNGFTTSNGDHFHTGTTSNAGLHTHTTNAIGGQGNLGLVTANTFGTATEFDSGQVGELNIQTTPSSLTVESNGDHNHLFTTSNAGEHNHQIFNTGGGQDHNNMQPTLFIGNMFIYSGKLHSGVSKWRYALDTNIL